MRIWEVKHHIDENIMMIARDFNSANSVFYEGKRLTDTWVVPNAYLNPAQPEARVVNFPFFDYGCLLCDARAWNTIQPFVQNEVELLPINVQGHDYRLLNPIQVIDCLDKEHSVIVQALPYQYIRAVDHYVFHPQSFEGVYLFKTPELKRVYIYCTEAFRHLIGDHQLTGLEFRSLP